MGIVRRLALWRVKEYPQIDEARAIANTRPLGSVQVLKSAAAPARSVLPIGSASDASGAVSPSAIEDADAEIASGEQRGVGLRPSEGATPHPERD